MTFQLIETHSLEDIQSQGQLYLHPETGAQVLWLKNDDTNRAFTISFNTPPYSDNGITHIIEHSVLNGSKKYPTKEPFVELLKGSLNTFVNAMTFSDKTIYPVASTNQKDFSNLMGVYLDAVFQPNFYDNDLILAQEGWHYHLEKAEDDLIYKGVVFNEMKGATASPEQQLYNHMMRMLYPDTFYQYESGGLPSAITDLTQAEFIDYHRKHYHPSNSLTIIYGDLDIDQALAQLGEYFDGKGKGQVVDLQIPIQKPAVRDLKDSYSLAQGDDPTNKDYLALVWHTGLTTNSLEGTALEVINKLLMGHNEAPLKKALLEADIAADVWGEVNDFGYPTGYAIVAKHTDAEKQAQFKQIVFDSLQEVLVQGLDKDQIEAALNRLTFVLKEEAISESSPRGVIAGMKVLSSWQYQGNPYQNLEFTPILDELRTKAANGYLEDLIREKLVNNDYLAQITLVAEPGKSDKHEEKVLADLQAYKAQLDSDQVQAMVDKTQALIERQEASDTPEDLATIPMLTRQDLKADLDLEAVKVSAFGIKGKAYNADLFTSGIDYLQLFIDISDLPNSAYPHLGLLAALMGRIPTQSHSETDLQTLMDLHTGGLAAGINIYEVPGQEPKTYFVIKGKALEASLDQMVDLMKEIFLESQWTAQKDILQRIQAMISSFQNRINYGANALVMNRALAQYKASMFLNEQVSGIDFYNFLKASRDALKADQGESLTSELQALADQLANPDRLSLFYVGQADRLDTIKAKVATSFKDLASQAMGPAVTHPTGQVQNEAFVTAQDVNYVGLSTPALADLTYAGKVYVLGTILRLDYLWNNVRVKGGAYGAGFRHVRTGNIEFASYRDPNIDKTLATYLNTPAYIDNLALTDQDLLKYIIGTLSSMDQPLSAYDKGVKALSLYLTGQGVDSLKTYKEEVLAVQEADLKGLADSFRQALASYSKVVIGNKTQIQAEADQFDQIYDLF
ncbi:insulinase family protein [Eremococcus coleocola]|uniref:Peptidase M16 inactive domain protein n=1 Tax=Eremococcus coleocola ACS-139-V-Col8 TaxID=908337 RepID=E4KPX2_9LACT|nr:insulinase family protein [Eremococcus coleocola]EFR31371.1 peptidase M16 inactive domain protein [Eremococcus coleocola ACS-139-V-Col8]